VNRFFADTFYWVALIHRKDASNRAVLEFSRTLASDVLITTDEVLTEVLAFCSSDQSLRVEAVIAVRAILATRNVRVIPQTHEGFLDGLTLYENRPDKGYSLVLSNDRHFEQEGFRALFR
jgi:predicted nucleic acid-binding protein